MKNKYVTVGDKRIRQSIHDRNIRVLVKKFPTLNFTLDECPDVVIVPVILDGESVGEEAKVGTLEYQISDGIAGHRNESWDVYSFSDAIETARDMQKKIEDEKV